MRRRVSLRTILRPSSPRLAGRSGAVFLVGGGIVCITGATLPAPTDMDRAVVALLGSLAVAAGAVTWFLPWNRWPWWSTLSLVPLALALLSLSNAYSGYDPYSYGPFYVVIFVWLGISYPPLTSVVISPLAVLSYVLPLRVIPGDFGVGASSIVLVLPTCVMVGEVLAWGRGRLLRTEGQLRRYSAQLEEVNGAMQLQERELLDALERLGKVEAERRSLLERTVDSLEDERRRIAIELHDGPIQHLSALDYNLETVRRRLEAGDRDAANSSLTKAQELVRGDVVALRHLMTGLRPPALDEHGLSDALRDYVEAVSANSGIACRVDVDLPDRLDPTLETVLYRVAQEALTNVVKHSGAREAIVVVREQDRAVVLEVKDDGVGFPPERLDGDEGLGHYGLMGMRHRVEMVGGSWEIQPNPTGGTRVSATIPLLSQKGRAVASSVSD